MINQQTPWVDISGSYEERLEKAIVAVDATITESTSESTTSRDQDDTTGDAIKHPKPVPKK
jgi:hypothetical protein